MNIPRVLTKYRSEISEEIRSVVDGRSLPLYDMMRYHLGITDEQGFRLRDGNGKAIRPALCIFSCEAMGGSYQSALPIAAAVELVHNFSLIHDDIQDNDRERRHKPTVWAIWGKPQAINAGTAMHILANSALLRLQDCRIPSSKILQINRRLDEITLDLIEGQYLDISFETRFNITKTDYFAMIEKKTGALLSGAMELGATIGTDNESLIKSFRDIGLNLGMAFQIKDDILGVWGNRDETGKLTGSDIRRRKKSFPVVYALSNMNSDFSKEIIDIYKKDDIDNIDINRVLEIFEKTSVRSEGQQLVAKYCDAAARRFESLNVSAESKDEMSEFIAFLTDRTY